MNVVPPNRTSNQSSLLATYADLEAVPKHLVAEIIDGRLVTHPRPVHRHTIATGELVGTLRGPFRLGQGGPGGWIFAPEPELHLGPHVVVPDIAGWRREHLPSLPDTSYLDIAPDWICEILSASTERRDRGAKMRIYAESGVSHFWLLDPRQQLLEAFALSNGRWTKLGFWSSADEVRAPPFDAISFSLAELWPLDKPLGFAEDPQALYAGDR